MDRIENTFPHCCIHCCACSQWFRSCRKHHFPVSLLVCWMLPSTNCCLAVCFTVVAYQWVSMPQHVMSNHWLNSFIYLFIYAFSNYFCPQHKPTYLTNSSSAIGGSHNLFNGSCRRLYKRIRALWLFASQLKSSYSSFLLVFLRPLKNYRKQMLIIVYHSLHVSFHEYGDKHIESIFFRYPLAMWLFKYHCRIMKKALNTVSQRDTVKWSSFRE